MIITVQMIRDKLFFKGPMPYRELEKELNFPPDKQLYSLLETGKAKGDIMSKRVECDAYNTCLECCGPCENMICIYYTRWTDET